MYVTCKNKQLKRIRILESISLPITPHELNKINIRKINYIDDEGRTHLMIHSIHGHLEEVKKVFSYSDVDCIDDDGWTALMYAANSGHVDIVRFLIEQKADVHVKTHSGLTAAQLSYFNGEYEISELLNGH